MRRRARAVTWGLFVGAAAAVLAPVGPDALIPLKLAVASADSVGNDVYVAVVVDFGSGSSLSSVSKCVPVPLSGHDSDALAAAVGQANVAYNNSGLLCAIDNYPANGVQTCGQGVGNGDYDYWSYWHGSSGSWVYANDGPTEQSVSSPSDDVEGWRFQVDEPDNPTDPPPGLSPSYAQICNASTEVPPPASPSPTVTTTSTSPPSATTTTGGETPPRPGSISAPTTTQARVGAAPKSAAPNSTTTSVGAGSGTPGGTGPATHTTPGEHPAALASSAPHHTAGGSGSTLLPVVLVAAVVAVLGGVAFFRWRRRPAEE
jgi:hypothetical protein